MTRLTARNKDGTAYFPECFKEPCCGCGCQKEDACKFMEAVCEKLAEFEDIQESGRLIELPCKVGDPIWCIHKDDYEEYDYSRYIFLSECNDYVFVCPKHIGCDDINDQLFEMSSESLERLPSDIVIFQKKNVFSTKKEAMEAMKKLEEGE